MRTFALSSLPIGRLQSQQRPTQVLLGKSLAKLARKGSATDRALLAVDATGATVDGLTSQQATALAHANHTYVAALRGMTEHERAEVKAGRIKLTDRVNHHRKPITDMEFDALVTERAERALAVLDRMTLPNCELRTTKL
jgi:hypothetical protein